MSKRRPKREPRQRDLLKVRTSSGYELLVQRPPVNVVRAIQQRAYKKHPDPEPPQKTVKAATGTNYTIPDPDEERQREYEAALQKAIEARLEYFLEYIFQKRLTVRGYESAEKQQELVAKFADDLAEVKEWGDLDADMLELDDWQLVLRLFILADQADWAALMLAASKAFDLQDLSEQEVRRRVEFFRRDV